jgi:acyl carrier protein
MMAEDFAGSTGGIISGIVQGVLAKRALAKPPEPAEDLRTLGMTSLDMVNLMLAVEDEFSIEIPQAEMTPENFRSIVAIEHLVETVRLSD